jgi:CBS domain containing-hemolysin-like protein
MTSQDVALLVFAALLVPLAGVLAGMDSALVRVSSARVEEMEREGVRRAAVLAEVIADRPRHTNLLLLLRMVCELLATVLVARAMIDWLGSTWRAVGLTAAIMVVISYVLIGVGPRTIGRQHP